MAYDALRLSICIPTFNRASYLNDVLTDLFEQGVDLGPFEVIVGDNASPDDTPMVLQKWARIRPEVRYVRQRVNVGAHGNLLALYRLAKARYTVYLADDDRLNLAQVAASMAYLDEHPNVVAAYVPWEFWDERKGESFGSSHQLAETITFGKANGAELFNALINQRILPEICLFRTAALHAIISRVSLSYPSYVVLANLLDHGDVAFLKDSFYRAIQIHRIDGPHDHLGAHEVIYARDNYEAGLEFLVHRIFRNMGCDEIPADQAPAVAEMIRFFMTERLPPAIQLLHGRKNHIGVYEFLARRMARGVNNDSLYVYYSDFCGEPFKPRLARMAAMQSVVDTMKSLTPLEAVAFYRLADPARWAADIKNQSQTVELHVVEDLETARSLQPGRVLFVTEADEDRGALINDGQPPGLVLRLDDLLRQYTL